MKSLTVNITLCFLILFSPISFIFNLELHTKEADKERKAFAFQSIDQEHNTEGFQSFLTKLKLSIEEDINQALEDFEHKSKNKTAYQKLKNLFLPSQLLKQAESSGNHFTATPILFYTQRSFLNARQFQGSYLQYAAPFITHSLYELFEVYLI